MSIAVSMARAMRRTLPAARTGGRAGARRPRSIADVLARLVLAALLPGVMGTALFLFVEYRQERQRLDQDALGIAQTVGMAVDMHVLRLQSLAQSFAGSRALEAGDYQGFAGDVRATLASAAPGTHVVLYRGDGVSMLSSADGAGAADGLPRAYHSARVVRQVFAQRRPVLSELFVDERSGEVYAAIHVPVLSGGRVRYSLAVVFPSRQLTEVVLGHHVPDGWLVSILDQRGRIGGRNRHAREFAGQSASATLRSLIGERDVGTFEGVSREGVPSFTTFSRSARTGYVTVLGIPRQQVVAPLWRKLLYLSVAAGALFGLGLLLSRLLSREISESIGALIVPAEALGRGETVPVAPSGLLEAQALGGALRNAGALLQRREAVLRAQQEELEQFKFFSEHANEMLLLLDEQGGIRYANRMAAARLGYTSAELGAMSLFQIDRDMNPARFRIRFDECRHAQPPVFERVFRTRDGEDFPVEITATVLQHRGEWLMHVAPRDISERREAERALRWSASHDHLTGLPNRAAAIAFLEDVLAEARSGGRGGALLYIDMDRFKRINDLHGQRVGDNFLREVANRLHARLPPDSLLARVGSDEFMMIVRAGQDATGARDILRAVLDAAAAPIAADGIEASVSMSIGVALFPAHGDTCAALMHAADLAMLSVRQHDSGPVAYYSPDMGRQEQARLAIERRLQAALAHGGLATHYQPIVDLDTGAVSGVEALLRLDDGILPAAGPAAFIPVAEHCGLIAPLGEWCARDACAQQRRWEAHGRPLSVAINVSPLQFRRDDFLQSMKRLVDQTGIDPGRLVIELTESSVMEDLDRAVDILHALRGMGLRIALDDFGTGYSSLSCLSVLPLDKLKIDQSFVRRMETDHASRAVIDAVIAIAGSLNLQIVAEGIETREAMQYLRERGCHQGQGYFFSPPLAAQRLADWIDSRA